MEICYEVEGSIYRSENYSMEVPDDVIAEGADAVTSYISRHDDHDDIAEELEESAANGDIDYVLNVDFELLEESVSETNQGE